MSWKIMLIMTSIYSWCKCPWRWPWIRSSQSSSENEPNSPSRHLEDSWNNPPNVKVGKPGGPPNVKETYEERICKYLETQRLKKTARKRTPK